MTVAAAYCIVTLGGCAPRASGDDAGSSGPAKTRSATVSKAAIAMPGRALLQRQPEPDCAFKGPLSNPVTAEETRMKLDYEQQCYRQSESIVRTRLHQLQDFIKERRP